ncbi:MAG: HTH domain-containing protein, partial [Parvularcula sp.]|nr:HTH domain-containing protein [Parvularcula sp.]
MHYTPQLVIDDVLAFIATLPPRQIPTFEAALATARRRAETVLEIDAVGAERSCPHCGGKERTSWGSTRTGVRRWRCKGCARTFTGRTGTPMAHVHQPGLFVEAISNMLDQDDEPMSCRKLGRRLGVSRDTIWRWRMVVIEQLRTAMPGA